ncbi:MAG: glycosyltransferase family 9 protein, partial [Thermovirgaceae bacterium]|nr:glycosyltransferase family 9 protein [Thermovirgaceae bacterium]
HFTVLAGPQAKQVLEEDPLWDSVRIFRSKRGLRGRLESVRMIRSIPHDLLIDLRSSAMPLFCGARYAPLWVWRELFLPKKMHEAERNIWCMTTIGVPVYSRRLRFFVPEPARNAAADELRSKGADLPWILFNPGSNGREKMWPAENFSVLAKKLIGRMDFNIGVTGYSDYEQGIAGEICRNVASPRCVDLSGRYPITRLGALLEQAVLFVSNDTGPLHVASAVGTPTVGFYLPWHLPRFGPWGNPHRSIVASDLDGKGAVMNSIGVDEVFEACMELLNTRRVCWSARSSNSSKVLFAVGNFTGNISSDAEKEP